MANIIVNGAAGRMGRAIINSISETKNANLSGALEHEGSEYLGKDASVLAGLPSQNTTIDNDIKTTIMKGNVIIDFTTPEATLVLLEEAVKQGKSLVIGTTGFSHQQRDLIKDAGKDISIVMAPNMSVGVNVLLKLVYEASSILGNMGYDMELVESHHNKKKDAPSGTAIRIAEVAAAGINKELDDVAVYERKGIIGERTKNEIGIQSLRAGDIVGDHTLMLAGPGERIELTHRAHSRSTFSQGAVEAALWVYSKQPGLYDMQDVLGLK